MKISFYKVFTTILVMITAVVLFTACVPSSPEKAKENLEKEGYTVSIINSSDDGSALVLAEGQSARLTAAKGLLSADGTKAVTIVYFKSNDYAKTYYNDLKARKDKEDTKQKEKYDKGEITKEKYDEYKASYKIGRFGKTVWEGSPDAVKAAGW